ncbi:MAG: hypothetical protein P4L53_25115 [Candidatus Obscuribacterales bacterium]|nr:hypothetical protein [Candidatus Obscuribacterales bacterium]
MNKVSQSTKLYSLNSKSAFFAVLVLLFASAMTNAASAQTTTYNTPYMDGTPWTPPGSAPYEGPIPAVGCGTTPWGVNPGQTGSAATMPWNTYLPANTIDQSSSQVSLSGGSGSLYEPYTMGMSMTVPAPPSAPGAMPSYLQPPTGSASAAAVVNVNSDGSLPADAAPTTRTGFQSTQDLGLLRTTGVQTNDYGYPASQNPDRAQDPQVSDDGPRIQNYPGQYGSTRNAQPNLPNSSYVNLGTGTHTLFQGPDLRARQTIAPY